MVRKKVSTFLLCNLLGLLIITSCNTSRGISNPTPAPSIPPQVISETKSLPTPLSPGQEIIYKDIQVTMDQAEITDSYPTEYGSNRVPSNSREFLWVHIIVKNIGQKEQNLPTMEHFSVLSVETEFKSTYGHRKGYKDYLDLSTVINQGVVVDAWLRFDVFTGSELKDLKFAFLPESTQVSFGFSSNEYFWADHPIYLWNCVP